MIRLFKILWHGCAHPQPIPSETAKIYSENGTFIGYGCNKLTSLPKNAWDMTAATNLRDYPDLFAMASWTRADLRKHLAALQGEAP